MAAADAGVASTPLALHVPADGGAGCGTVDNTASDVRPQVASGNPPAMLGGTLEPGTYDLSAYTVYGADAGTASERGSVRATLEIEGSTLTYAAAVASSDAKVGFGEQGTLSLTIHGNVIDPVVVCGTVPAERATYTAAGASRGAPAHLAFLFADTLLTFTKR